VHATDCLHKEEFVVFDLEKTAIKRNKTNFSILETLKEIQMPKKAERDPGFELYDINCKLSRKAASKFVRKNSDWRYCKFINDRSITSGHSFGLRCAKCSLDVIYRITKPSNFWKLSQSNLYSVQICSNFEDCKKESEIKSDLSAYVNEISDDRMRDEDEDSIFATEKSIVARDEDEEFATEPIGPYDANLLSKARRKALTHDEENVVNEFLKKIQTIQESSSKSLPWMRQSLRKQVKQQSKELDKWLGADKKNRQSFNEASEVIARSTGNCIVNILTFDILFRTGNDGWINDEIVNFCMDMLQDRDQLLCGLNESRKKSHFFNSFLMAKILAGEDVSRWTRSPIERHKIDVFSLDKIFIPINFEDTHWMMAIIFIDRKEICIFDSFREEHPDYLSKLNDWISNEEEAIGRGKSIWKLTLVKDCPLQSNTYDCGVFAIMCANYISDNLPLEYSQTNMSFFRAKIASYILQQNFNYPVYV
jgi:Ulp1 family protease